MLLTVFFELTMALARDVLGFYVSVSATLLLTFFSLFDASLSVNLNAFAAQWGVYLASGMKLADFLVNVGVLQSALGGYMSLVFLCIAFRLATWVFVKIWGST